MSVPRERSKGKKKMMMKTMSRRIGTAVLVLALTTGCAGMSTQEQRALSGGAIGAAGGAAIGALGGSPTTGAIVGGAVGAATGALWDDIRKSIK